MPENIATDFREPRPHMQLDTLLRMRWLTVLGQLAAIFVVGQGLEFDLPEIACFGVIAFSAAVNIVLQMLFDPMARLRPPVAAGLFTLNLAELDALLFLTGGLQNPFAFLFLVPVLLSATSLPPKYTLWVGLFATASASALAFFHLPLPWNPEAPLVLPITYMFGVWLSIVLAIGVTSLYAFQATEQARKLSDALAATELVLTREQHLTQLDGLAAAAAHELGTPLATITLIASELEQTTDASTPLGHDVRTLREQSQRCREILGKLTQLSADGAPFDRMRLTALIEEAVAPHREFGIALVVRLTGPEASEPVMLRNPAVLYGLGNILENAVDFARETVEIDAWWDQETVHITIADDGPGIAPDLLKRIGEPYLSKRAQGSGAGGLGLGIFIARTLLERSGAKVTFQNRRFPSYGAVVDIVWPRSSFETDDELPQTKDEEMPRNHDDLIIRSGTN